MWDSPEKNVSTFLLKTVSTMPECCEPGKNLKHVISTQAHWHHSPYFCHYSWKWPHGPLFPKVGHMIPTEEKKNTKTLSLWPTDDLLLQSPTGQNFWKLDHFWPAFPANRPGFLDKIGMWFWCSPVCNFQLPTSNQQKRSTRKKMMWSFIWTAPGSRGWPCLLSPLAASTSLRQ